MERKDLIKENDKLAGELARKRDKGRCQNCGYLGNDIHHIVGRVNLKTRWNLYNLVTLCRPCHSYAHKEVAKFNAKFAKRCEMMLDTLIDDSRTDVEVWNEYLKNI